MNELGEKGARGFDQNKEMKEKKLCVLNMCTWT